MAKEEILFENIKCIKDVHASIAVQLHLFYIDLLDEFKEYFSNIPFKFDLYVSVQEGTDLGSVTSSFKTLENVHDVIVRPTQNRGRDIARVYVLFREEIEKHDYFLHVHSKKSMYRGSEQSTWRRGMLDGVLGSEQLVRQIFTLFEDKTRKVGLYFPETIELPLMAHSWLQNGQIGKNLLAEMGFSFDEDLFNYPTGSFFWAKTDAVRPLFDRKFTYEDFPIEAGQTDGTLAHALERAVAYVCRGRGYILAIGDNRDKLVRMEESEKLYRPYLRTDIEDVCQELKKYQIVSFDIFDTLITRKIYEPDDVFVLMGELINKRFKIACNFLEARKKAEFAAKEKHGVKTTIDNIYDELCSVLNVNISVAQQIKKLEIDLEVELAIPRKEVVKVFNELIRVGKRVILTSDMYITSDIIKKLLDKCNINGYEALYVSCEIGKRKDRGDMWKFISEKYRGAEIVHVGDNLVSDIQLAGDVLKSTYYVMNPRTAFKMSDIYKCYQYPIQNRGISSAYFLGKVINEYLYNDPFNLKQNCQPVIGNSYDAGCIMVGPLFTGFMQWIVANQRDDEVLLFLSREGYALQPMYQAYCEGRNIKPLKNYYFLTSRRSASVAALHDADDMDLLFEQDFDGEYKVFLKERFGIDECDEKIGKKEIHLPEEKAKAKKELSYLNDMILENSEKEKKAYLSYIHNLLSDEEIKKATVIDLGYSGTIQYYLSKLLGTRIGGKYMCTGRNIRPDLLGCEVQSIYKFDYKNYEISKLQHESALLEAILEAPFGQLMRFEMNGDKAEPCYKESKKVGDSVVKMQSGIYDFIRDVGHFESTFDIDLMANFKEALELFTVSIHRDIFAENVLEQLKVEDGYCLGGELHFGRKGSRYLIVDGVRHSVTAHNMRVNPYTRDEDTFLRRLQRNYYGIYIFLRKTKGLLTGHGFRVVGEL